MCESRELPLGARVGWGDQAFCGNPPFALNGTLFAPVGEEEFFGASQGCWVLRTELLKEGLVLGLTDLQYISAARICGSLEITCQESPRMLDFQLGGELLSEREGQVTLKLGGCTWDKLGKKKYSGGGPWHSSPLPLQVGDGTTSVTLLAAEFLKQIKPYVEEGVHPQIIIRAFRTATQLVRVLPPSPRYAYEPASLSPGLFKLTVPGKC